MITKTQKKNTWKIIMLIPIVGSMMCLNACNNQEERVDDSKDNHTLHVPTIQMDEVDFPPQFLNCPETSNFEEAQGCFHRGLSGYLLLYMNYPKIAQEIAMETVVYVGFTINTDGILTNAHVVRTQIPDKHAAHKELFEIPALRVFENFPTLRPAQKDKKLVEIAVVVPVKFTSQKAEAPM
jgi:outer membrane biosynthesis protein TonB